MAHPSHKGHDPSPERDLDANVSQQKQSTEPGDTGRRSMEQRLAQTTFAVLVLRLRGCLAEFDARGFPECSRASCNFNSRTCNLESSVPHIMNNGGAGGGGLP